jgi:5-methyltetrahydrofolate--homocysteine methyltransferase
MSTRERLHGLLARRVLLLDGAMGTMMQRHNLTEEQARGDRFRAHAWAVRGNYDLLALTNPAMVSAAHHAYLSAGADIIETNTFSSTGIAQALYGLEPLTYEINVAAARLARVAADGWSQRTPDRPRFVAGAIGPTPRRLSDPPGVSRPPSSTVAFDAVRAAYREQVGGLIDGGVDVLLLETIVDGRNADAATIAIEEEFNARGVELPLMVSAVAANGSGRLLSGETLEAFYRSIRRARPFSVGLNCGPGAHHLRPLLALLSRIVEGYVTCHPSAGLPDAAGRYEEEPAETAALLRDVTASGFVNIVGGCCGTTPDHIRAIGDAVKDVPPRRPSGGASQTT